MNRAIWLMLAPAVVAVACSGPSRQVKTTGTQATELPVACTQPGVWQAAQAIVAQGQTAQAEAHFAEAPKAVQDCIATSTGTQSSVTSQVQP